MLVADPERIETTKYAEMGVPMFVIGEDAPSGPADASSGGALTSNLGEHFRQLANALAARKPDLVQDDVAKLLEILAERHFMDGGNGVATATTALAPGPEAPPIVADLSDGMARGRAVRVVNFHATPRYREPEFREQIAELARHFEPITPANFASAVEGRWDHPRPGVMPVLFEGYRDNLDVLLPILEEFGFTAWFFVPSGFLSVPAHEQRTFAAGHQLHLPEIDEYPDQRIALTWDEAREIVGRGHAFACHTRTHHAVLPDTPRAVLDNEIVVAKAEMEAELGTPIDIYCWLEGAATGVNPEADTMLRDAGFRYLFSNFKIQRLQ